MHPREWVDPLLVALGGQQRGSAIQSKQSQTSVSTSDSSFMQRWPCLGLSAGWPEREREGKVNGIGHSTVSFRHPVVCLLHTVAVRSQSTLHICSNTAAVFALHLARVCRGAHVPESESTLPRALCDHTPSAAQTGLSAEPKITKTLL